MDLASSFRSFGREAAGPDSPLYAQLCELIVESPELLALAASAEGTPMVFLATVHDELLRDPAHALAAFYPTVGARRRTRPRAAAGCCPPSRRSATGGRSR